MSSCFFVFEVFQWTFFFFSLSRTIELTSAAEAEDLNHRMDKETLMDILDHVRQCFPNCLDSDIVLINCAWELWLQWNGSPLFCTQQLLQSLVYLDKVFSSVLKHNVACMGWKLFVQSKLETLTNLVEKMGKKPKDRVCRKELTMGKFGRETVGVSSRIQ